MTPSLKPVITADHMQLASFNVNEPFLPDEIILQIFSHLNPQELGNCRLIASRFSRIDDLLLNKILQHMTPFGKEEWETYFGEVGEAPPLPPLKVFKEIYKTYMLVLLPATVDGKPLTLNLFKTLAENPKDRGHVTKININNQVVVQFGDVPNVSSRWVFFPKNILDISREKTYRFQIKIVAEKGVDYEVTRLFDAVISIASRHVQSGKRLFDSCFTRCQETVGFFDVQLTVGGFRPAGLCVSSDNYNHDFYHGVAAVRKCPFFDK